MERSTYHLCYLGRDTLTKMIKDLSFPCPQVMHLHLEVSFRPVFFDSNVGT